MNHAGRADLPFNAPDDGIIRHYRHQQYCRCGNSSGDGRAGALFWMWMTALVGMATKYSEAVLAVRYREVDKYGQYVGGPMYYIKNGLGPKWVWLGTLFAVFGACAGSVSGNTVQANPGGWMCWRVTSASTNG